MSIDLTTTYLGLKLKNPIAASCSPLTGQLDSLKRLEDGGVSLVTLPSLFEEQIEREELELARLQDFGADGFAEALNYFPEMQEYNTGPDRYLELIQQAKTSLGVPVVASLNGHTNGGWLRYAKMYEEAGADAIELNVYLIATDPDVDGATVEARYVDLVSQVAKSVSIPVAVKVGPYFSSMAHMARQLQEAGAKGLVLFNRFMQPDIDLETLSVKPALELSTSAEVRLPLRWIAILSGRVQLSLAANSGIHDVADVLKVLLAGANLASVTSVLLKRGPTHVTTLLAELKQWLAENEYESVQQLQGSVSQRHVEDPAQFERANYMKAIVNYTSSYL